MSREADDYSPFSEDADGRLIRLKPSTIKDLTREINIIVDGVPLKAFKAKLLTDAQGNSLQDEQGLERVRSTTILDVIRQSTDYVVGLIHWLRKNHPETKGAKLSPEAAPTLWDRVWKRGEESALLERLIAESRRLPGFGCDVLEHLIKRSILPDAVAEGLRPDELRAQICDGKDVGRDLQEQLEAALVGRILLPPDEDDAIPRVPVLCHQDHLTPVAVCRVCSVRVYDWGKDRTERILVPACQYRAEAKMAVYTMWSADGEDQLWDRLVPYLVKNDKFADDVADEAKNKIAGDIVKTLRDKSTGHRKVIRQSVETLAELLTAQCWHPERDAGRAEKYKNELATLWETLNAQAVAFPPRGATPQPPDMTPIPASKRFETQPATRKVAWRPNPITGVRASPETFADRQHFAVDYDSCILCDRCIRSCGDVRGYHVLGRTGKGAGTHIAFDLDGLSMAASSCYSCGECMKACPTGAITFDQPILPFPTKGQPTTKAQQQFKEKLEKRKAEPVNAQDLVDDYYEYFGKLSRAYLEWNHAAVRRREVAAGDVLVQQGEFGTTAFLTETAHVAVFRDPHRKPGAPPAHTPPVDVTTLANAYPVKLGTLSEGETAELRKYGPLKRVIVEPQRLIGEMSVITHDRRTATMVVVQSGTILELDRNIVYEFFRVPELRAQIADTYGWQAFENFKEDLRARKKGDRSPSDVALLPPTTATDKTPVSARRSLYERFHPAELDEYLGQLIKTLEHSSAPLVLVERGGVLCKYDDAATDFFFVHQGFVKLEVPTYLRGKDAPNVGVVPFLCGQGEFFGDFALLKMAEELYRQVVREADEQGDKLWEPLSKEEAAKNSGWDLSAKEDEKSSSPVTRVKKLIEELSRSPEVTKEARRSAGMVALDSVELFRFPLEPMARYLVKQALRPLFDAFLTSSKLDGPTPRELIARYREIPPESMLDKMRQSREQLNSEPKKTDP